MAAPHERAGARKLADALVGRHRVHFQEQGGFADCPVYERARLPRSARAKGPAIFEQMDSTTVLFPGRVAVSDRHGNLILAFTGRQ